MFQLIKFHLGSFVGELLRSFMASVVQKAVFSLLNGGRGPLFNNSLAAKLKPTPANSIKTVLSDADRIRCAIWPRLIDADTFSASGQRKNTTAF